MGEFPDEICKVSTNKRVILLLEFLVASTACMMQTASIMQNRTHITLSDAKIGFATNGIFRLV